MKCKLFLGSLTRKRNLGIAVVLIMVAYFIDMLGFLSFFNVAKQYIYFSAIAIYLGFVVESFFNKNYFEEFSTRLKVKNIKKLNKLSKKLFSEAKQYSNETYFQKLKKVINDKDEILRSFFRDEKSFIKEKLTEQSLNFLISHLKLATNFCIRSRELSKVDVNVLAHRISLNKRKIEFMKDPDSVENLNNLIEIDEKMVERVKDEKQELDRTASKLDVMESTINMLKHQMISRIDETVFEKIERTILEAKALDNVLDDKKRNRTRY